MKHDADGKEVRRESFYLQTPPMRLIWLSVPHRLFAIMKKRCVIDEAATDTQTVGGSGKHIMVCEFPTPCLSPEASWLDIHFIGQRTTSRRSHPAWNNFKGLIAPPGSEEDQVRRRSSEKSRTCRVPCGIQRLPIRSARSLHHQVWRDHRALSV